VGKAQRAHHLSEIVAWNGGHAALCPDCCGLICFTRKRNLGARLRQTGTTGKSLLIFRSGVKSENQKYSAFVLTQISGTTPPVSPD